MILGYVMCRGILNVWLRYLLMPVKMLHKFLKTQSPLIIINGFVLIKVVLRSTILIETILYVKCVESGFAFVAGEEKNIVLFILLF